MRYFKITASPIDRPSSVWTGYVYAKDEAAASVQYESLFGGRVRVTLVEAAPEMASVPHTPGLAPEVAVAAIRCEICGDFTDDWESIRDEVSGEDVMLCVPCWQHAYQYAFGDEG